ncbi:ribonuclease H-like domain-containing protein [Tanacetum coccineum]
MVTRTQVVIVKPTNRLNLHTSHVSPIPKSPFITLKDSNWKNVFSIWKAFGGNTRDLGSFGEETDKTMNLHQHLSRISTQKLETASQITRDAVTTHLKTASQDLQTTLNRYKARLVENGSSQQLGIDCDETFSPVVKPATIHIVLSLALSRHWPIHQLDVKNAFLNDHLSETVYMHQLPDFVNPRCPNYVCLLQRSLYGLKQASCAWFQRFAGYVIRVGFSHSRCDSSLFIYRHGVEIAYLLIYVDDIVLTASSTALLQRIISSLHREFEMTDLGALNYFLGIFVSRNNTGMFLS